MKQTNITIGKVRIYDNGTKSKRLNFYGVIGYRPGIMERILYGIEYMTSGIECMTILS